MPPIRVLVVDDAVVVRRVLTDVLSADADIVVAGTASNGRLALAKIPQVNPDVVVLDVEMPEMDGLAALGEIRRSWPTLPVIMFSTLTERGASATLDALSRGASDYVTKPSNTGSIAASVEHLRAELVPKIKHLVKRPSDAAGPAPSRPERFGGNVAGSAGEAAPARVTTRTRPPGAASRVDVLAIGVSTGGPNALAELLPTLPADLPVPVVIVQHMPPVFTRLLADRLDRIAAVPVAECVPGEPLRPGTVWIAPGDHHMTVVRAGAQVVLAVNQGPQENSCRPAVDVLFRSVTAVYGPHTLAVIMTGMGQDGLRGCEHVVEAGGQVVVQDERTSVVWGMPGFVARAGLAEKVLPLGELGGEIVRRIRRDRGAPVRAAAPSGVGFGGGPR